MNRRAVALLTGLSFLLLPGCYGDVESFSKAAAKHNCRRQETCYRANFDDQYNGDMQRCRDDQYTDVLDFDDTQRDRGCEYDKDDGKRCIKTLKEFRDDCSDAADEAIFDDCIGDLVGVVLGLPAEVYVCNGALEFGPDQPPVTSEELASWPES